MKLYSIIKLTKSLRGGKVMKTTKIQGRMNIMWIKAYLECLFDAREVEVLKSEAKQLELYLW